MGNLILQSQVGLPMQDWWQKTFPQGRQQIKITDASGYPVTIAYGEKGTGQPLFLVHGIASWSYAWRHNIDALAEHYRVICFDAKGCGFSEKPLHDEQSGHQIIELIRVMQALTDRPAIVVAESLGALTALGAAQSYPEGFSHLIVMNVPIFPRHLPHWGMRILADVPLEGVRLVDRWRLTAVLAPLIRQLVHVLRHEVVADPAKVSAEEVYWATYPHIEFPQTFTKLAQDLQLAIQEIRALEKQCPNLIQTIQDRLSQIQCPTLVLWSDHDRWFPVTDGLRLRERLPNAVLEVIPNCGHYAAGDQPEWVNQAILKFLDSREG